MKCTNTTHFILHQQLELDKHFCWASFNILMPIVWNIRSIFAQSFRFFNKMSKFFSITVRMWMSDTKVNNNSLNKYVSCYILLVDSLCRVKPWHMRNESILWLFVIRRDATLCWLKIYGKINGKLITFKHIAIISKTFISPYFVSHISHYMLWKLIQLKL